MSTAPLATLLSNAGATGSYVDFRGGDAIFTASGTFGGATITLAFKDINGADCAVAGVSLTAAGAVPLRLPQGQYKAVVAGGAPSALYAALAGVPGR